MKVLNLLLVCIQENSENPKFRVEVNGSCLKTDGTSFNSEKINLYITYEIKSWPCYLDNGFTLRNYIFGGVKLTKNADPDKYFLI